MKITIYILLLVMIGCSPQRRLNNIIKKNPHLRVTETETVHDTIPIPEERVVTELQLVRDSVSYDSLLEELIRVKQQIPITQEKILEQQKTIALLKRKIIKVVMPDTTYTILQTQKFEIEDSVFSIKTNITIHLSPTGLQHDYYRSPIKIPYTKKTVTQTVDARVNKVFFKDWWFWLFVVALLFSFRHEIVKLIKPI